MILLRKIVDYISGTFGSVFIGRIWLIIVEF